MKKLVTLTLVVLCSAAFVRCSGGEEENNNPDAGQSANDAGSTGGDDAGTNNGGDDAGTSNTDSGIPTGLDCDPVTAAGCDPGKKCSIISGPTQQRPNDPFVYGCTDAGLKKVGESCLNEEDCDNGLFCLPVSTTQAVCTPFCYQDSECPTVAGNQLKCKLPVDESNPTGPKLCGPDCDPISNTGCEASQKCSIISGPTQQNPNASVVFGCAPKGTKGDGEDCANDTECGEKFFCALFQGAAGGKCTQFCANDSHCPTANNQKCIGGLQGYPSPLLCQAVTTCDPLAQDCTGNQGCYPTPSGNICAGSNNKDENVACNAANDCKPGLICLGAPGSATCKKICNMTAGQEPSCATGTCQQIQGQSFGACN